MARKTGRQPLKGADYERLAEFRYLLRQFLHFSEGAAEGAGITPQQHQALLALKGFGAQQPLTVGELAERLGIKHHSAVGLADRLLAKSLIERRTGVLDRRRIRLKLTPQAERLLARLTASHRDELQRIAPLLQTLLEHFRPMKKVN